MSTPKKLVVYSVDLNTMKKTEMARFELESDEVKPTYTDLLFECQMEEGLFDRGKTVKIDEGEKFMEALERAYSRSSTITVERA